MEKRLAKIIFSEAGGTASKGAKTCKVTLPTAWVEALGVVKEHREVELYFDGEKVTLSRCLSAKEFANKNRMLGHDVRCLRYYDGEVLCTTIYADFTDETIAVENHVSDPVKMAFGNNPLPDWADYQAFLRERCVPKERDGLREYLESLGLAEYNPLDIIQKTRGRMAEDQQWLEMEVLS